MIGSNTMIVKQNSKYSVHVYGGCIEIAMYKSKHPEKNNKLYKLIYSDVKKWKNPDRIDLTEKEMLQIADATSMRKEDIGKTKYSELAGDITYMIDVDAKILYKRDKDWRDPNFVNSWVQL